MAGGSSSMSPVPGNTASDRYAGSLHIQPRAPTHWSTRRRRREPPVRDARKSSGLPAGTAPTGSKKRTNNFPLELRRGAPIPDGQPVPEFIVVRLRGAAPTRQVGDSFSSPHHISLPGSRSERVRRSAGDGTAVNRTPHHAGDLATLRAKCYKTGQASGGWSVGFRRAGWEHSGEVLWKTSHVTRHPRSLRLVDRTHTVRISVGGR